MNKPPLDIPLGDTQILDWLEGKGKIRVNIDGTWSAAESGHVWKHGKTLRDAIRSAMKGKRK